LPWLAKKRHDSMAYFQCFLMEEKDIQKDILSSLRAIEETRIRENEAVIKIQSWFRSQQIQAFLRFLHQSAGLIQKTYRGYAGRRVFREKVQNELNNIRQAYYDQMTTKIQSRWRGFYVRKYKFDFYARKRYLNALLIKNESVREHLNKVKIEKEKELENQLADKELAATLYENRKNHYLLSTQVSRGIYNSPSKPRPDKEVALRQSVPLSQTERELLKQQKEECFLITATGIPKANVMSKKNFTLPPLTTKKKLQGPFREPVKVQQQRFKELQPTLRVATQFKSVDSARTLLRQDEWTKRVIDQSFLPATKRNESYISSLHTTSSFRRLKYGNEHFREVSPVKQMHHPKDFQRHVSPIPVFDQLGKTY